MELCVVSLINCFLGLFLEHCVSTMLWVSKYLFKDHMRFTIFEITYLFLICFYNLILYSFKINEIQLNVTVFILSIYKLFISKAALFQFKYYCPSNKSSDLKNALNFHIKFKCKKSLCNEFCTVVNCKQYLWWQCQL